MKNLLFLILLFMFIGKTLAAQNKKIKDIDSLYDILHYKKSIQLEITDQRQSVFKFFSIYFNDEFIIGVTRGSGKSIARIWDMKGQFIGQVGNNGKGPGEYVDIAGVIFNNNEIYLFDNTQKIVNKYTLKNRKIQFVDRYDLSKISLYPSFNAHMIEDSIYLFYYITQKGEYKIVQVDKNFTIKDRYLQNQKGLISTVGIDTVYRNHYIYRDQPEKTSKGERFVTPYIHFFNFKTKKNDKKLKIGNDFAQFRLDTTGKYLINSIYKGEGKWLRQIFDISNGKRVHQFYSYPEKNEGKWAFLKNVTGVIEAGEGGVYQIFVELPDIDNKSAKLHFYEINFGDYQ